MPEGHSVHRLARQFQDVFADHRLRVSSPQGRFAAGAALLDQRRLAYACAHGKQLFLHFDNGLVLRTHLGLYGAWDFGGDFSFHGASSIGAPRRIGEEEIPGAPVVPRGAGVYAGPPEPQGAVRVRLVSAHGWADLRGPSACEVLSADEADAAIRTLGPDPLHNKAQDESEFIWRITASRTYVAVLLMKQDVLAGVGNVYRAEVLFRQRLSPWLPGTGLAPGPAAILWRDIASVMAEGVRDGRIITTRAADRSVDTLPVPAAEAHYVYKRNGLPCRICGTEIALTRLAGRKLYWCPSCQGPSPG